MLDLGLESLTPSTDIIRDTIIKLSNRNLQLASEELDNRLAIAKLMSSMEVDHTKDKSDGFFSRTWDAFVSFCKKIIAKIEQFFKMIADNLKKAWAKFADAAYSGYDKASNAIKSGYNKTVDVVKSGYDKTSTAIKTGYNKVKNAIHPPKLFPLTIYGIKHYIPEFNTSYDKYVNVGNSILYDWSKKTQHRTETRQKLLNDLADETITFNTAADAKRCITNIARFIKQGKSIIGKWKKGITARGIKFDKTNTTHISNYKDDLTRYVNLVSALNKISKSLA